MANSNTPTLSPEDKAAAREAARADKPETKTETKPAEKAEAKKPTPAAKAVAKVMADVDANEARGAQSDAKVIAAQLRKAGVALGPRQSLTDEQSARALDSAKKRAGLSGKALATYILEGRSGREQVAEARARRARAAARTRSNATRSSDPEAAELAKRAAALAPDVKSAFLPRDAREFIDLFEQVAEGQSITVTRRGVQGVEGAIEEATFRRTMLKRFGISGEKDQPTRAALSGLGRNSRLWGRKLALFILAVDSKR